MSAVAAISPPAGAARKEGHGVAAVLEDQATLDRVQGIMRELRLDEELVLEPTLDAVLRRIREGYTPRVLILDLSDSAAPIAELSAARSVELVNDLEARDSTEVVLITGHASVESAVEALRLGATDYLVKPVNREALTSSLEIQKATVSNGSGLGEVVAFVGSRGGVGATTTAVSCAWLLGEKRQERTALVDLDLHFGTVGLKLDTDPGTGLCEALEQPSRIDSLFVERAMIKLSDTLRMLAAEAALGETMMVDPGAIDVLLYELRRKFSWVLVDLPRWVNPTQRVVLGAATRVIILCERSLAGLRDTIRLQALIRENAPQARILLVDGGASGERATVGKSEFEKAIRSPLDAVLPYDAKSAGAATNAGQPLPMAAPRSPVVRELEQLVGRLAGTTEVQKRKFFGLL
jgi:pilus assembly protein CpaE